MGNASLPNPDKYIYNGRYQKIVWLGVNGFIIVNEIDKEFLMIDPWPSYSRDDSLRIDSLVTWIAIRYHEGYECKAVFATHEHFDHIADIPKIFLLLFLRGIDFGKLPLIYADRGTLDEIKKSFDTLIGDLNDLSPDAPLIEDKFAEIQLNGSHLYYDDEMQKQILRDQKQNACGDGIDGSIYPLVAGTKLLDIKAGSFTITPYIWDHSSTYMFSDSAAGDASGNYQRTTALLVSCEHDTENKKTFFVGSAGEMCMSLTGGFVKDAPIATDVLVQALPQETDLDNWAPPFIPGFRYHVRLSSLVDYQKRNIAVRDTILACHYENFCVVKVLGFDHGSIDDASGNLEKDLNKNRVVQYRDELVRKGCEPETVQYLNRFLIEFTEEERTIV